MPVSTTHKKKINIFIYALFFLFPLISFSQMRIKCRDADQIIPNFKDGAVVPYTDNFFVQNKVLQPITESISDFEIRVYYSGAKFRDEALVINCEGNKIRATRYNLTTVLKEDDNEYANNDAYKDVTPSTFKSDRKLYLQVKPGLLTKFNSWNEYFSALTANHIGDIPSAKEMDALVKMRYPEIKGVGGGLALLELKVGKHFRNVISSFTYFDPEPYDIKMYLYKDNIFNLLSLIRQ